MSDQTPATADESADEPILDTEPAEHREPVSEPLSDVTSDPVVAHPVADHEVVAERAGEYPAEPVAEHPVVEHPVVGTADETGPVLVEPEEPAAPETAEFRAAVADPADRETVVQPVVEPVVGPDHAPGETGEVAPVLVPTAVAAASAVPAQQRVYLEPDLPPKRRGNRLLGVLLSLVGAAIFAGVYALVVVLINHLEGGKTFGGADTEFINVFGSAYFTVAVGTFLVLMILLVLLLNRAGWWAHVLGSLILAIAVYFVAIGALLFIGNTLGYSPTALTFSGLAVSPWVIAAAVVAREVSIWTGLGIAARGRRVKARNAVERDAFDREQEAKKAEYAGTVTGV